MGIHKEKYTKTYFSGKREDGSPAGYGVENFDSFLKGEARSIDGHILSRINFLGKRVLEFGFGRGEAIKYALDHEAESYEGVDFAPASLEIAKEFLALHGIPEPTLHCADALDFLKTHAGTNQYDVVLMFDFVEHVPRNELRELFELLRPKLCEKAIIAINTPAFRVDNDVILHGLNPQNMIDAVDSSNLIEETSGMYCNLYTVISLQSFMNDCGYEAITEAHFFRSGQLEKSFDSGKSYRFRWEMACKAGYPLAGAYMDDVVEYAYTRSLIPICHTFENGDLQGISLLIIDAYLDFFPDGYHDREMMLHLKQSSLQQKVIFDVGGFMGMSSLLFAKLIGFDCEIICFEPNPWNRNRINNNLSYNPGFADRIECFGLALGDKDGYMNMLCSDLIDNGHSSTSQLTSGDGTDHSHEVLYNIGFHDEQVPVITLDSFVKKTGKIPDLIKVDIEGSEALLLAGAVETLHLYHPKLYIELHSIMAAVRSIQFLRDLMYSVSILYQEPDGRIMIACEYVSDKEINILPENDWLRYEYESLRIGRQASDKTVSELCHTLQVLKDEQKVAADKIKEQLAISGNYQIQNSALQAQNVSLQAHNAGLQAQSSILQIELGDIQVQSELIQKELNNVRANSESIQIKLTDVQSQNTVLQTSLEDAHEQIRVLQANLVGAQNQNTILQTELSNTQAQNTVLQSDLANAQTQNTILSAQLSQTIDAYETSASWRLTKPLRAVKRMLRANE